MLNKKGFEAGGFSEGVLEQFDPRGRLAKQRSREKSIRQSRDKALRQSREQISGSSNKREDDRDKMADRQAVSSS